MSGVGLTVVIRAKRFPAVAGQPSHLAIQDLRFTAEAGSFVAIVGPSGVGKTTLLGIVAGLDRAFEGGITFEGGGVAPRIGYVFQAPRLLPWRTVAENIALAAPALPAAAVRDLLGEMGLAGFHDAYPERLSIGMQRRVALARAFAVDPDILLLDEPFVSLDDATADRLRRLLVGTWERRRPTVLLVTHDRTEAVRLATRLLVLEGPPARIARDLLVPLPPEARWHEARVAAARARLFGDDAATSAP